MYSTVVYMAPEVCRERQGWEVKMSDMWSIGVIAFILLTGKAPFMGNNVTNIIWLNPSEFSFCFLTQCPFHSISIP